MRGTCSFRSAPSDGSGLSSWRLLFAQNQHCARPCQLLDCLSPRNGNKDIASMVAPLRRSLLTRVTRNPYVAGECFQYSRPCRRSDD